MATGYWTGGFLAMRSSADPALERQRKKMLICGTDPGAAGSLDRRVSAQHGQRVAGALPHDRIRVLAESFQRRLSPRPKAPAHLLDRGLAQRCFQLSILRHTEQDLPSRLVTNEAE